MKIPRQLSRLLLGLALLSFPGLAVTVTDHMVTKTVSTRWLHRSDGCHRIPDDRPIRVAVVQRHWRECRRRGLGNVVFAERSGIQFDKLESGGIGRYLVLLVVH